MAVSRRLFPDGVNTVRKNVCRPVPACRNAGTCIVGHIDRRPCPRPRHDLHSCSMRVIACLAVSRVRAGCLAPLVFASGRASTQWRYGTVRAIEPCRRSSTSACPALCIQPTTSRSADAQSENACRRKGAAIIPRLRGRCVVPTLPERAAVEFRGTAQFQAGRPCSANPRAILCRRALVSMPARETRHVHSASIDPACQATVGDLRRGYRGDWRARMTEVFSALSECRNTVRRIGDKRSPAICKWPAARSNRASPAPNPRIIEFQ